MQKSPTELKPVGLKLYLVVLNQCENK